MWQRDNVSEMFGTCYLFPFHLIKDGTKLICFLFVTCSATEMLVLATMFPFSMRGILPFQIARASPATRHGAECPRARQLDNLSITNKLVDALSKKIYFMSPQCTVVETFKTYKKQEMFSPLLPPSVKTTPVERKIKMWVTVVKIAQGERYSSNSMSQYIEWLLIRGKSNPVPQCRPPSLYQHSCFSLKNMCI